MQIIMMISHDLCFQSCIIKEVYHFILADDISGILLSQNFLSLRRPLLFKAISILSTHCAFWIKFIKAETGFSWVSFIAVTTTMTLLGKGPNGFSLLLGVHPFLGWCVTSLMISLYPTGVIILLTHSAQFASLSFFH